MAEEVAKRVEVDLAVFVEQMKCGRTSMTKAPEDLVNRPLPTVIIEGVHMNAVDDDSNRATVALVFTGHALQEFRKILKELARVEFAKMSMKLDKSEEKTDA